MRGAPEKTLPTRTLVKAGEITDKRECGCINYIKRSYYTRRTNIRARNHNAIRQKANALGV